jgi:hypothetical protein
MEGLMFFQQVLHWWIFFLGVLIHKCEQLQSEAFFTMKAKLKSLQRWHIYGLELMSERDEKAMSKLSSCLKCYSVVNQAL